jgi:hypothetical protein
MDKPIINYSPRAMQDRVHEKTIFVPTIVDRLQSVDLDTVIERAIDRGLIVGVKPTAAKSIADGLGKQMYAELSSARGVKFGDYFYARLYLDGTCNGDGRLTSQNGINVRLNKGKGFSLRRGNFAFQNVNSDLVPQLDFCISDWSDAERNKPVVGKTLFVNGSKLVGEGTETTVDFWATNATGEIVGDDPVATVDTFITAGPSMLSFTLPGALEANTKYVMKIVREAESGSDTESMPLDVTVVAAA